jgi:FMN phosphatase YigB (HAD superfamily)
VTGRIRAVLFDLDDTLLLNDSDRFLSHYYRALVRKVQDVVPVGRFADALGVATRAMERNDGGDGTNAEVFAREFFPRVGREPEELMPLFSDFYAREFEVLSALTAVDPAARELVAWAFDQGLQVAIATQPLFPRVAILSRLRWADVPYEEFPYHWVACYEVMRACKPYPHFFLEIVKGLGRRPEECLMVGDSPEADMPARDLGLRTYLVDRGPRPDARSVACDARGDLRHLLALLQTGGIDDLHGR